MTWLRDAMDRLISVGQATDPMVRDLHGHQRLRSSGELKFPPMEETVTCSTLDSFAALVLEGQERAASALRVHIRSPTVVEAVQRDPDPYGRRLVAVRAQVDVTHAFPFDRYLDAEDFIVRLQTGFLPYARDGAECETGDLSAVLALAGSLRPEKLTTLEDDGVTQVATVRRTAGRLAASAVRNPVALYPLGVTFSDIAPPRWRLILRLKQDGEALPQLAIFRCGDDGWGIELRRNIARKLVEVFPGVVFV